MRHLNFLTSMIVALMAGPVLAIESHSFEPIPRDESIPLLSWSDFHSLKESDRTKTLETIRDLMKVAEGKKITSGGRRFCVFGGNVREVSENEKCEIPREGCASNQVQCSTTWSDKLCVVREKDNSARGCYEKLPIFVETSRPAMDLWTQLRRLSFAYCSNHPTRVCDELKKIRANGSSANPSTSSLEMPAVNRSQFSWLEWILPNAEAKDNFCKYENDNILFPNGDRIFLDYGKHTDKYQSACVEYLFGNPSLDTTEFRKRAERCRSQGSSYTKDINSRGDRVQDLIKNNNIQWLGIEMAPNEWGSNPEIDEEIWAERTRGYRDLSKRHGYSQSEAEEIASMNCGYGGVCQAIWKNEDIGDKFDLTPIEGDEEKKRAGEEYKIYADGMDKLAKLKADNKLSQKEIDVIIEAEKKSVLNYKPVSSSDISAVAAKIKDPKAKEAAREFLKGTSGVATTARDRDIAVVRNARLKGGSGIISFGEVHKKSMNEQFLRACREELNHAPGTGVKPSKTKSTGGSTGSSGVK